MSNTLYIGNLALQTNEVALRTLLSGAGSIKTITIPFDRINNEPRGFAFVEMDTHHEAQKAIQMYDGRSLNGHSLRISDGRPMDRRTYSSKQSQVAATPRRRGKTMLIDKQHSISETENVL